MSVSIAERSSSTSVLIAGYDLYTLGTIISLAIIASIYLYNVNLVVVVAMVLVIVIKYCLQRYLHPSRHLSDLPDIR